MSLGAGGRMKQRIYADPYGFDAWDHAVSSRCFVTLVDAVQWREITGEAPATRPPTAADYTEAGLPWFDYYAADVETLAGAPALTLVKGVAEMAVEKGSRCWGPTVTSTLVPWLTWGQAANLSQNRGPCGRPRHNVCSLIESQARRRSAPRVSPASARTRCAGLVMS